MDSLKKSSTDIAFMKEMQTSKLKPQFNLWVKYCRIKLVVLARQHVYDFAGFVSYSKFS